MVYPTPVEGEENEAHSGLVVWASAPLTDEHGTSCHLVPALLGSEMAPPHEGFAFGLSLLLFRPGSYLEKHLTR